MRPRVAFISQHHSRRVQVCDFTSSFHQIWNLLPSAASMA